jgi:hypothetical protein
MVAPNSDDVDLHELAAILARGFLRLTEKRRVAAVSSARDPQVSLDVSGRESPHVVDHGGRDE